MSLRVHLGHAQAECACGATVGVFQVDLDFGVVVFAPGAEAGAATRTLAATFLPGAGKALAEQRFKEVTEISAIARAKALLKTASGVFSASVPPGWRTEILAGFPVGAELVIGGALFGVFQNLVGFAKLLEACFGIFFLADVGVVFARQLAVRALDVVRRRVARQPHDLVVVLEFHEILSEEMTRH